MEIIDFHIHLPVEGLDRQFADYYCRLIFSGNARRLLEGVRGG